MAKSLDFTPTPEPTNFRSSIVRIGPPWLQGPWGNRFLYSHGVQLDGVQAQHLEGTQARMPGVGTNDALPNIGNDKQILRGFQESDDSYITRLRAALDTWKIAGNAQSIMLQIAGYVSPAAPVLRYVVTGADELGSQCADYVTPTDPITFVRADPSNWDWNGDFSQRRFWIIIYPGVWTQWLWGDGHLYGNDVTWGSTATPHQVTDVRALVDKWKAAGTHEWNTIIAFDGSLFDPTAPPGAPNPDGTWGHWSKLVAGVQVPAREPLAAYWDGI